MKRISQVAVVLLLGLIGSVFFDTRWAGLALWGVLPAVAAVGAIAFSTYAAVRNFGPAQVVLGLIVVPVAGFSLLILKRIFIDGAWPTFVPHVAIVGACLLAGIQAWLNTGRASRS